MKLTVRLVFAVGALLCAGGVSAAAAEETPGPPQISQLEARMERQHFKLKAVIVPGGLSTSWEIEVENFQPCGPINEKHKPRKPKKVKSGTVSPDGGAIQVEGRTAVRENGARTFVVIAENADGEATSKHPIPQRECSAE
jgi:hypothetical protein